jgi:hypothetical protein
MRISASEALNHEWFMTGGEFLSPKTQAPIYLSSAQENMKKFQEQLICITEIYCLGTDLMSKTSNQRISISKALSVHCMLLLP